MPVIHLYCPGVSGKGHGGDYCVSDPELACAMSAKWQIMMLGILLKDDAGTTIGVKKWFTDGEFDVRYTDSPLDRWYDIVNLNYANYLLKDDAKRAKDVIKSFVPRFSCKEEYLAVHNKFSTNNNCVIYNDDKSITVMI